MRFLTAGESHGPALTLIVEGMPAGLPLSAEQINADLFRRQQGYGRGSRQKIERDEVLILGGVRLGYTTGGPIAIQIENKDWVRWQLSMSPESICDPPDEDRLAAIAAKRITRPRPGHADLTGALKYGHDDIRDVLERSSARETACRVAAGAIARSLLSHFGLGIYSHVTQIGSAKLTDQALPITHEERRAIAESSPVRCLSKHDELRMITAIDDATTSGHSLGGIIEIVAYGVPVGLGTYVQWDRRLDARIAAALMSINAVKGVEFGLGFAAAALPGSEVHDEIYYEDGHFQRPTNHAGGLEAGMSNGEEIVAHVAMKPIPTMRKPLHSVDLQTKEPVMAHFERADICAVPACGVIAEAMMAWVLADAMQEKFGGDSLSEMKRHFSSMS